MVRNLIIQKSNFVFINIIQKWYESIILEIFELINY